jgi:hypothetical protein
LFAALSVGVGDSRFVAGYPSAIEWATAPTALGGLSRVGCVVPEGNASPLIWSVMIDSVIMGLLMIGSVMMGSVMQYG